jgi:hypothetical protein
MTGPAFLLLTFLLARVSSGFHWRFGFAVQPVIALIAGLLILLRPKLLNYIVAFYLILAGLIGLFHVNLNF